MLKYTCKVITTECNKVSLAHLLSSNHSYLQYIVHTYTLHTCFSVHSPYNYLIYTLQAHVRFKIFRFSHDIILFILTLSTHVSVFTLHTVISFTLPKHMLGSKFSIFHGRSFCSYLHSPHMFQCFTLHTVIWLTRSKHMLAIYIYRFNNFGFSQDFIFLYLHSPHMLQCSLSI